MNRWFSSQHQTLLYKYAVCLDNATKTYSISSSLMKHYWRRSSMRAQVIKLVSVLVVVAFLSLRGAESRKARILGAGAGASFEYTAVSCRDHSASLTDFGGVGDGETSNTKALQAAIDSLSQYVSDGGAQLYVPAGNWLTGSFQLTSHFTLFLDKDDVLLASQDMNEWPVIKPLPLYGRGRDAAGGRYASLIFGTNLTDVVVTGRKA